VTDRTSDDEVADGGSPPRAAGSGDAAVAGQTPGSGADLARRALDQARDDARRRGARTSAARGAPGDRQRRRPGRTGTGAGPDPRDPQLFGTAIRQLLADRGWESTAQAAGVLSGWDTLVGADLASHCQPRSLVDGELVLVAESTAWATQVRLLSRSLLQTLERRLGPGVVTCVRVQGPTAPSWSKGPRRVAGRGPRDTYG
jgi:predicted nucleic acid-binding Zn ribbon protein